MVEGTPLLRVQIGNGLEGSNPFLSATISYGCNQLIFLMFWKVNFVRYPTLPEKTDRSVRRHPLRLRVAAYSTPCCSCAMMAIAQEA